MNSFNDTGKLQHDYFKEVIFPLGGAARKEVVAGPQYGVDVSVIRLPNGMDMALTSDPLSWIPSLGWRESAWLSVHLMANDMATTGVAPQYAQFVLNLPGTATAPEFETYWQYIHTYCKDIGVAITGGHTGKATGQQSTLAGGGTMAAIAPTGTFLLSRDARPGDVLLITREAALIATSILALSFPETVKNKCGTARYQAAGELFWQTSSLQAGLIAAAAGAEEPSVTAMHDVTEGGVLGAICELAQAAGCGALIEKEQLPVGDTQQAICKLFGIDPLFSVGAGSMIIATRPGQEQAVVQRLQDNGIKATIAGVLTGSDKRIRMKDQAGERTVQHPGTDPYWAAFFNAFKNGWK